jgi:hypothetical protein
VLDAASGELTEPVSKAADGAVLGRPMCRRTVRPYAVAVLRLVDVAELGCDSRYLLKARTSTEVKGLGDPQVACNAELLHARE